MHKMKIMLYVYLGHRFPRYRLFLAVEFPLLAIKKNADLTSEIPSLFRLENNLLDRL